MPLFLIKGDRLMAIDFSDVAKPIDEKQLPNQAQAGLVDFSDVAKPIGTNESRNANQWSPANGTIFDQIDQQKLMYDPNLPDATIGRVFMAGVKDAFEGYAGGSAMEAAESRNIMGMTPEQIKAHLGEGARNSLMGDYALTKMEHIDNNYIKNKEGIKAGIRDGIVDKATALAKMADPGDYNLPTSFLGQLVHDTLLSTPYSMMSAVPSIATGALTGGAALPTLIVSFLTSMGEASSEGGRTYMSMIEAGKSHDEAYAAASKNKDFNTLMLTLSNMVSGQLFGSVPRGIDEVNFAKLKGTPLSELSRAGQVMGKAMERPLVANIAKSPIKRGAVALGAEFATEGSEEMIQSVSDATVRGEDINVPNLLYEGLIGGLSGAGQSSVGIAFDYIKNRKTRDTYKTLNELNNVIKGTSDIKEGNNTVVADALAQFKGKEHDVMFDTLNERNRILALPLEERSRVEDTALPVLSEAVKLFSQGKAEEGLRILAENNINFDFEENQLPPALPTRPLGATRDVTMHPQETVGAIGDGVQLQEIARAEFNRLRSIPEDQRTKKDNRELDMYRNIMEAYTAGNNVAGDLGLVAQRTVSGQPINLGSQQVRPIIPGRSFNNAELATVEQGTPMDRTYVGEPRTVNGGFIVNKPDGNAVFVPQAEMGGYYQVGNEQPQAQIPTTPQPAQTQPIPRSKKQQKPAPVPQVRDGVGTNDIYQASDGVAYWVRGFDANNKIVMSDNTGSILRVTPEQLGQNFQRLSPARREQVSLSAPVRSEILSLSDTAKAAEREQAALEAAQKKAQKSEQPTMVRTPETAKAAAKAKAEKQAKPTTEKKNITTPAQTTTEQEQMARGDTAKTLSESTTTKEVAKEGKVSKVNKKTQDSAVKVGEKYKNKTGQVVVVRSVENGQVAYDLEKPGMMKPSPSSVEQFTAKYSKVNDDTNYSLSAENNTQHKRAVTAKDISSSVKGARVETLETGIIRMQFKNGFVLHVDPNSDAIVVDPDIVQRDYGRKLKPGEMAVGKATVVGNEGFIRLVAGMTDMKAFNHELYHIAEKMVLTDEQIAIVKKAYGGTENRANAFADVAFKRQQDKNKLLTSIFQKIADFFADIRASIFGEKAEDIFRSVAEGKAWEQKLKDATKNVTGVTKDGRKMWVVGIPFTDKYMVAYHGTHAQGIEAFSLDYVDTGEGAQMFGWGLYFTDHKGIGKKYKQAVSERYNQRLEAKTSGYMFDVLLGGEVFVPNNRWLELTSDIINQIVDNTKWRTKGLNAVTAEALNDVEEEIKRRINNAKDHIKWTEVALETRESLLEENLRQGNLSSGEETENAKIKTLKSDVDYAREKKQVAEKSLEGYERAYEWFKQNKNSITFRSRGTEGSLYTVEIPDDEGQYLYWDKPLNAQSDIVKAFLEENEDYIDAMPAPSNSDIDEIISTVTNRWNAVMEQLTGTDAYKIFIDKLGYDEGDFDYSESDGGHIYPRWDTSSVSDSIGSEGEQKLIDYINKAANTLREQFPAESGQLESIAIYASRLVNNRQSSISRWGRIKGEDFYEALSIELGSDKEASLALNKAGIIGIKYLNGMSRSKGEGGYNYVIFNDKAIQIIEESYLLVNENKERDTATDYSSAKKEASPVELVPSVAEIMPYLTEQERAKVTKKTADNLVKIYNSLPDSEEIASVAWSGRAKKGWYKRSCRAIMKIFGYKDAPRFTALLASLSPQTSVEDNLVNALKVWTGWVRAGRPTNKEAILKILGENVQGDKGEASVLDAWKNNAFRSLTSDNPIDIVLSGPKVNSFTQNLLGNMQELTNDTWVAIFLAEEQILFRGSINKAGTDPGKGAGYLAVNAKFREAADVLTRRTRQKWEPAEIQETIWSWTKALLEKAESAGENRTTTQILDASDLTHDMINSVPDFEVLFLERVYKNILEEGGYEKGIRDVERDVKGRSGDSTDNGMGRDASASEGAGVDGDTFQSHLKTAAERIEKVRKRRAGKTERTDNWWGDRKRYAERLAYGKPKERSASPYRRGDNRGRWRVAGLNVVATQYKPTIEFETHQGYSGDTTPVYLEISGKNASQAFHNAISEATQKNPYGASVEIKDASEYNGMRLFVTEGGDAGFAITKEGDLVSLFATPKVGGKRAGSMLFLGIQEGARTLDCFDTVLPHIYSLAGFRPISRIKWNNEYAPKGWDYDLYKKHNNGRPDVVFMVYDPNHFVYHLTPGEGVVADSYDSAVALRKMALDKLKNGEKLDTPNEGYRIAGEEPDSTFKAPPVTLRAIKRAVPGAKVSITKDGLVQIEFKNGFVVNVNLSAKSIKIDQDVMRRDYGREATAGDIAVGRNYVTVDGEAFIDIVSGMTDMRTFHHELYEVARRMALSGQQLDILDKAFKGNKEAEAEAYADFMVKRLANQSKLVNSLFQKISDFFADIRAKMFGQNSDDIFRQIGDSKVAMDANVDATGISPEYRIVGMGGQKFSSPAEVTMVTPADKQVAKQKVASLQYVPAPQTTWKTDSGRNKKDQAAWHALTDGLESVVEKREPRMTLKERIVHVKDWIVDNWIDNLSIIQRTADEKLYRHARGKVDGISSKAEKLIKFGDKKRGVEGLTQIFKGMSDEEFKGFLHYAEYKNIIDIINNSEEAMRFISKAYDEIASEKARLKELRSTKPLDADDAKQLARGIRGTVRYIEQLQKDIDHSLEYVREVRGKADQYLTTVMKMEKLYPDWVERQQKLTKYTNNLLRINRDSGMISANLYRFLTETRPNYLPALRDFSDEEGKVGLDSFIETRGFVNLKSPLRRMHGSKRDIVNPIDEIIANTFRTMSLQAKQEVATSFIDFYEDKADGDEHLWRTTLDKAVEDGQYVFFVRRDGEKHYYATDSPALYEALTMRSASRINLGAIGKPAELITKILRQSTTRAIRFMIRNPERDNFQAAIYGEGFIPFVTAFKGGIEVVGGGEWFERFLEAGGAQGISTVDSDRLADMKAEILGKKFFRSKNPLKNIWNLLGRMAEVTELSTRVGQFKKAIELGYTDEEAAYIARDLMNFGIGGSDAKQMNRYIPFLTASIQDMNRFYRGHSKKNIAKTVRRAMMYITIPTLALWFWNNGDDDRKEYWDKLATWEKNAFWWIILNKDTAIPVAKPFLLGLVYGSLPERFMDYWLNNDRRAVEDFGKTLLAQTMPGYMPLALQLVMELGLNKSFFYGREIVPANEQKLEGKLQYGPYTAEWAKTLGSISGISPRKLEYAVFGVTGSLGKETSAAVDDIWRSVSGATRPDKYITEYIPGSTAWISHGRNHMGPLYQWNLAFPALEEAYRSAKKVLEVDGPDALSDRQRLLVTYEADVKAILKLNTAKDGIWKLQGLKNKVVVDKNMTAEQKRKAVDEINARIILLSQVGLKKLDFFQDAIDSMEDKMEARR